MKKKKRGRRRTGDEEKVREGSGGAAESTVSCVRTRVRPHSSQPGCVILILNDFFMYSCSSQERMVMKVDDYLHILFNCARNVGMVSSLTMEVLIVAPNLITQSCSLW